MLDNLQAQYERPQGLLGWLVGWVLTVENREVIEWAVRKLDLQPGDQVLEIGYGPGLGIERAARKAAYVAGVDISEVMLSEASQRNAPGISSGQIDLRQADAAQLPFAASSFDKVFTINTFHLWPDTLAGLAEARRVLKPGGTLAIVEQPPEKVSSRAQMQEHASPLLYNLEPAGFNHLNSLYTGFKRGWAVCVLATI